MRNVSKATSLWPHHAALAVIANHFQKKANLESSIATKEAEISKAIEEAKNAGDGGNPEQLAKLEKQLADLKKEVETIEVAQVAAVFEEKAREATKAKSERAVVKAKKAR